MCGPYPSPLFFFSFVLPFILPFLTLSSTAIVSSTTAPAIIFVTVFYTFQPILVALIASKAYFYFHSALGIDYVE